MRRLPLIVRSALSLLFAAHLAHARLALAHENAVSGERLAFADLPGWAEDDHSAALLAFRKTCRMGQTASMCRAASRVARDKPEAARRFFERWFEPFEVSPTGFLTGYYEPELPGSLASDAAYPTPLLARPSGLVLRPAGPLPSGWPEGLAAARRMGSGYEAYPDRAAIEEGALGAEARPIVFLADPVDAFTIHVQGSARIRLAGGRVIRVGFDGRNGHPYTSVGRVLADAEGVARSEMTADRLFSWLKAHPERAPAIMRANRSYIFFRRIEAAPDEGPIGGAGLPLTAGRSLAVDRTVWRYGTLVWLDGELPRPGGGAEPLRRLVVAQDTGTAIVGEARGDLFFGSGPETGSRASLVRHPVRWVGLRPKGRAALGPAR